MNSKPQNKPAAKTPRQGPKPPKKITESYLHNSGLYYLQRFAASSGQFREVMLRKVRKSCRHHSDQNFDDCSKLLDALIVKFQDSGLLNDESYTRGVVNSLRRQGKSRRAIMVKLKTKGVGNELIDEKLEEFEQNRAEGDGNAELTAAVIFARRKKLGPFRKDEPEENTHEKALSVMARAGFSYDIAQNVLKMNAQQAEDMIRL